MTRAVGAAVSYHPRGRERREEQTTRLGVTWNWQYIMFLVRRCITVKVPQTRTTFTTLFIMIISVTVISGHVLVGHIHELTKGVTMNVRQFTLSWYSVVGWYSIQVYFVNLSYTNFEKLEKSKDFQPITHACFPL